MNFAAGGDYVMVNTPAMLRAMAARIRELGVRPELEVFDTGHLVFVHELIRDGLIDDPPLIQLCTGIPYGAPDDPATLLAMVNRLPPNAVFSAFSIGRMQLPFVALAPLLGGNVRVGLEDNLYLSRGRLATNAELVARAVAILEAMNVRVLGPAEVREKLALRLAWLTSQRRRPARRRRDRRRLGGALPAERRRRAPLRPGARGRAQRRRGARERPPRLRPADARAAARRRARSSSPAPSRRRSPGSTSCRSRRPSGSS